MPFFEQIGVYDEVKKISLKFLGARLYEENSDEQSLTQLLDQELNYMREL
jgi:hypothetical protein